MRDMSCPYCDADIVINHDGDYGLDEDVKHQHMCHSCGKTFVFTTYIDIIYNAYAAPCLNAEEDHDLRFTNTYPKEFTKLRCIYCDHERFLTTEEMNNFLQRDKE